MERWSEQAARLERTLRERLLSANEFAEAIDDLTAGHDAPVTSIHVQITQQGDFPTLAFGLPPEEPDSLETPQLDSLGRATARVSLRFSERTDPESRQEARDVLSRVVKAWWRGQNRDEKGKILSAQYPDLQRALEDTVALWAGSEPVAVFFADIDHFKLVNDYRTEQEGDRLIAKLAAILLRHAHPTAIVIHRSGDEFLVISPSPDPGVTVVQAARLRSTAERELLSGEEPFDGAEQLGLSVGVAIVADPRTTYADLEARADRALKPGGEKRRGRVSVELANGAQVPQSIPADDVYFRHAATALALSSLANSAPFANAWLDAVSTAMFEGVTAGRQTSDVFAETMEMVRPEWDSSVLMAFLPCRDTVYGDTLLSPLDAILACAHGIGRAAIHQGGGQHTLRYTPDGSWAEIVGPDGLVGPTVGELSGETFELSIAPLEASVSEPIDAHRALLVSLGADPLPLPHELFYETVYVDDRPTAGGGLPDLWQAALARVVAAAARNPNVARIVVVGNAEFGVETLAELNAAARWTTEPETVDRLAAKIAMPTTPIRRVGSRIGGRVVHASNLEEAVSPLISDLQEAGPLLPLVPPDPESAPPRLTRRLEIDEYSLGPEAGCRVPTASVAYPIALDVVRQTETAAVRDQSGREVRELIDFRVHLTTPTVDPVPRFHADELPRLDRYFETEFCNPDGLFRRGLEAHNQFERVIDHVTEVVQRRGYTSRRALLVVPHIPEEGRALAPLGLVSVRTIARPAPGGTALDYSFTWRTVEALVGLPYSLYGSIRFAEYMTQLVRVRLGIGSTAGSVRMGEVSYIAHSLHLFLDEYAERIARRIVSDDTA